VHVSWLIGFDNRLLVLTRWAWSYFTFSRGARLITGPIETPVGAAAAPAAPPPPV
jgi:NADH dehydrogenase